MAKKVDMVRGSGGKIEIRRAASPKSQKPEPKRKGFFGFGGRKKDDFRETAPITADAPEEKDWLYKVMEVCVTVAFAGIPIFFLPWGTNVFEWNKQFLLLIVALVAFIAWLARAMIKRELRTRWSFFTITVVVFLLVLLASSLFSVNRVNSFLGAEGIFNGSFISYLAMGIIAIIALQLFRTQQFVLRVVKVFSVVVIAICGINILHFFGVFFIPMAGADSALFTLTGSSLVSLALFMAASLVVNLGAMLVSQKKNDRALFLIAAIASFALMFLLDIRSAWLVSVVSLVILFAFSVVRAESLKTKTVWIIPIFLALAVLFIFVPAGDMLGLDLPSEVSLGRPVSVEIVKGALKERPILGSGVETFLYDFSKFKTPEFNKSILWNVSFDKAATEFLQQSATIGIVGLVFYYLVMGAFVWTMIRGIIKMKDGKSWMLPVALFSAWSAVFLAGFLYSYNTTLYVMLWMLMALGLISVRGEMLGDRITSMNLQKSERARLITAFVFLVVLVGAVAGFYFLGRAYAGEAVYAKANSLEPSEEKLVERNDLLIKALQRNSLRDEYRIEYSNSLMTLANVEAAKAEPSRADLGLYLDSSIKTAKFVTENNGEKNVTAWKNLARIYSQSGRYLNGADEWSVEAYNKALELAPNDAALHLQLGKEYVKWADRLLAREQLTFQSQYPDKQFTPTTAVTDRIDELNTEAEQQITEAVELKDNYLDALVSLAQVQDRLEKFDEATENISLARVLAPENIDILYEEGRIRYNAGEKEKAAGIFEQVIEKDSEHLNATFSLGVYYQDLGLTSKAIETFENLHNMVPDNDQVTEKLEEIKAGTGSSAEIKENIQEGTEEVQEIELEEDKDKQ